MENDSNCNNKLLRVKTENDRIAGLYNIGNTIGRGHYAVVKEAKHVFTGEKVAIKVIDKTKLDVQAREHLFSEVMCMKLVQHPNVVRLYEVIDSSSKLYLILELGDGGDLYDYIMKFENGLPENEAKRYFRQIVQAIAYCHHLHIVHRDLKPENVVFFEKLQLVKLTDFGFSNKFIPGQTLETSCGSLAYSAPEILLGDAYDAPKVDIWSLGIILYILVSGHLPFDEANDSETLAKIMDCKFELPNNLSGSCKSLIKSMVVRDPERRATLDEILAHKWLEIGSRANSDIDNFSVPLITQQHLTVEEHLEILTKMSEGNLATVEEIQLTLDRNEYSYISATYFLLAERKLKRRYVEEYYRLKFLEFDQQELSEKDQCTHDEPLLSSSPTQISVPSNNAVTESNEERFRRFSMILEDEEDEEEEEEFEAMMSLASVREELETTFPKPQNLSEAPQPSRCCSRSSDDQDNDELENIFNIRFSNFRQQFNKRSRCRSAVYNRLPSFRYSRSLSSIPSSSQILSNITEENNDSFNKSAILRHFQSSSKPTNKITLGSASSPTASLLSSYIPRFYRNFSGTFNRRTNSIISGTDNSFDDNVSSASSFQSSSRHRISLPNQQMATFLHFNNSSSSGKRRSFPALYFPPTTTGTLSHSHSSSDVSDSEATTIRGYGEQKRVSVPKSFGKHFLLPVSGVHQRTIKQQQQFPSELVTTSNSSIASCSRRLRIKSSSRSRPNSMGATMTVQLEDFQSLLFTGGSSNEDKLNSSSVSSSSPTGGPGGGAAGSLSVHRDICAPIHEEEELIRSRSYIDKETATVGVDTMGGHHRMTSSYRSVSVDCRRKSDSAEGTPSKLAATAFIGCRNPLQSTKRNSGIPIAGGAGSFLVNSPLQPSHRANSYSLSSHLTQSNFSLSSFASSLRESKAMMNVIRGAFELQCLANRRLAKVDDRCRSEVCASANVSGRESRCEFASITSLPLGQKAAHSPDDGESLLGNKLPPIPSKPHQHQKSVIRDELPRKSVTAKQQPKSSSRAVSLNSICKNLSSSNHTTSVAANNSTNSLLRAASSSVSKKARSIFTCCRTS